VLRIHRAERADRLADALAQLVVHPPDDPFAPEIVAVPTRGVERWLAQRLSGHLGARTGRGDGVCANVEFPFPGRLVGRAVAGATGQADPDADPWAAERSVWALLDVVHDHLDDGWLSPLAAHLGRVAGGGPTGQTDAADGGTSRRFTAVRHIADLFDHYGVHRPAMVRAWAAGDDTDGEGRPLPADVTWQAELWRHLRNHVVIASPAERLADACDRLRAEPGLVDLPGRLSLFGLTRLPASYLDVLHALAAGRDVHLFLLHPSPVLWDRIAAAVPPGGPAAGRADDPTVTTPRHPLLSAWARDAREMQLVLARTGGRAPAGTADEHHPLIPDDTAAATLLARLQADVRADRVPPGRPLPGEPDRRAVLAAGDRSLQVHACHGRARQIEVLRDAILHALAADPTLEPRDVIVMCPDIDVFAPLIHATFGTAGPDIDDAYDEPAGAAGAAGRTAPVDLRVRLADRSIRQTNPVLGTVSALLAMAGGRLTASQVVDLAGREPVRRRFRFDDDDIARIEAWVASTGIRWGLDPGHRSPFKMGTLTTGTWRAGLDRLLVGVTMAEDRQPLVGGVLPLDDVDSGDIDLAGRLAELLDRLEAAVASFAGCRSMAAWADAIATAADALTATGETDDWQRAQLAALLGDVVDEAATAGPAGSGTALGLDEVQALLADRLRGRPTRANFRTGHLTMCTLVPMRSVPHRVVCLVGLDDGAFPRRTAPDGDDVIARAACVGDHDPRSEDRQLLLDAVLSATGSVVVTYTGRDERTNEVRPPAVPLGELLDVVDATARTGEPGTPARDRVVVHHPLQPFDPRNFTAGALVSGGPWGFDGVALAGARAMAVRTRSPVPPLLRGPLPAAARDLIELDDLVRFVQHPVRAFLRQRLGISVRDADDEPSDALSVELDGLGQWGVGQRLLEAQLAGVDPATSRDAELARGLLPPGALGTRVVARVLPVAGGVATVAAQVVEAAVDAGSVQVDVDLGGCTLVGTVPDVFGDCVRAATYSRVGPRHRLASWVRLLGVAASHPGRPFRAVTVGRGPRGTVSEVTIPPQDAKRATEVLAALVDLHDRGLCEPLPLYGRTSAAYAAERARGRPGEGAARKEWESTYGWDREDREPEHQLVLGGVVGFDAVAAPTPAAGESGPGWPGDEPSRFGRLARRLWDDLLAVEQVVSR
jgi:exodeoxyribonuclease V gamma subunit